MSAEVARLDAATAARRSTADAALIAPATPRTLDGELVEPIRSSVSNAVIDFAKTLVSLPMGAHQVEEIEGQRYVFVLERHYHPPGFVGAPNGWHKGVTAYFLKTPASAD
jgi:hypothetical protein